MKEIKGVTHPIPTEYAERIYNEGKTVFVSKKLLGRVLKGDKFIIYESHGAQAYTSWADIKSIGKQKTSSINRKYGNKLMLTKKELKEYAKDRTEMNVIEFENLGLIEILKDSITMDIHHNHIIVVVVKTIVAIIK